LGLSGSYNITKGTAVAQWLKCCARNRKVAGSIPASVSEFFIDTKFFRSHYGPGVVSAFNRNDYQEYFLEEKAAGAQRLSRPPTIQKLGAGNHTLQLNI